MSFRHGCTAILVTLALALAASPAAALRCGSHAISEGDSIVRVLNACGEPAYRDNWQIFYPYLLGSGLPSRRETWYYNFGPSRLLYVLEFSSGRLQQERTEGYGFYPQGGGSCKPEILLRGRSKYQLLEFCGEPAHKQGYATLRPQFINGALVGHLPVLREEWTYDFGSRRLLRMVILENGVIADVQTGRYGH
ncbi:MAG: DUF2845 domain-containing protein [Nevskiales bacterium]